MEEITISIRPKERKLLDEIRSSDLLNLKSDTDVIRWSLSTAKIVLVALEKQKAAKKKKSKFLNSYQAIDPSIYDAPSIPTAPAPAPALSPDELSPEELARKILEEHQVSLHQFKISDSLEMPGKVELRASHRRIFKRPHLGISYLRNRSGKPGAKTRGSQQTGKDRGVSSMGHLKK